MADIVMNIFVDVVLPGPPWPSTPPHRLEGQTLLDGQPVRRRIVVQDRRTGAYITSTVTQDDGIFAFRHLPAQSLANPYLVLCFDDRPTEFLNAMVYDRVYQVDDNGNPPQN